MQSLSLGTDSEHAMCSVVGARLFVCVIDKCGRTPLKIDKRDAI